MNIKTWKHLLRTWLTAVLLGAAGTTATAATITFSDLAAGDFTPVDAYAEQGFWLLPATGFWFGLGTAGDPAPSLLGTGGVPVQQGVAYTNSLLLGNLDSTTPFVFESLDLFTLSLPVSYLFIGYSGTDLAFYSPGVLEAGTSFTTLANPSATPITLLALVFTTLPGTNYVLDNVVVTAVPEAATLLTAGIGLLGIAMLLAWRRRSRR